MAADTSNAITWPPDDLESKRRGGSYYEGAAICRRGHVETRYLKPDQAAEHSIARNCEECGAKVLTACPTCTLRIRGEMFTPGVIGVFDRKRPSFCDGCGAAFPWASRAERIYELENLLDEEDIDEADRVVIQDHLVRLRADELSPEDERNAWARVAERAGSTLRSGPVARVMEGLVTASIRQALGL